MFLTTEPSVSTPYRALRVVHATVCKGGQMATENALTKRTEDATEEALGKLAANASALGADGVIGLQISTSAISTVTSVTVIGTAIKL